MSVILKLGKNLYQVACKKCGLVNSTRVAKIASAAIVFRRAGWNKNGVHDWLCKCCGKRQLDVDLRPHVMGHLRKGITNSDRRKS